MAYDLATAPLRGRQATAMREYDETTKPQLERQRDSLRDDYEDAVKRRRNERKSDQKDSAAIAMIEAEMEQMQIDQAAVEKQLCPPFLLVSDTTPESLAAMLARRGEVLAHFDSDANDTIGSLLGIRYGNGDHTTESLHLKAWSGESFSVIRKGSAKGGSVELFLERPTLACLFVVTPDVARKICASDRMMTGGLLPRFLLASVAAAPKPWTDAPTLAAIVAQRYEAAAIAMLDEIHPRQAHELDPVEMTVEAFDIFKARHQTFCDNFTPESSAFAARHTENAIRIALVLHAWQAVRFAPDGPANCAAAFEPMTGETARRGLAVAEWFESHQAALLAPMREAAADEKFEKLLALCKRRSENVISARDLTGARIAADTGEADKLLKTWEEEGRVVRVPMEIRPGVRGPTKPRFRIKCRA